MNARRAWFVSSIVAVVALSLATIVPATGQSVPGVTSTQILLGGVHPYSGPASGYSSIGKGAKAYFDYINDTKGGVYGRKVIYKDLDDGYNPPQSLTLTKQLVEQDHVFAMFNPLGTPVNVVLRPYLNDNKVPQLFVATGATTWALDSAKYPWTIGWQPDYQAESIVYAKYLLAHDPNAKIGVIYQNDDYGQDYLNGLNKGLGSKTNLIVKTVSYETTDPDVKAQIATLKSSGADTVFIFATPKFSAQSLASIAQLSWKPTVYLNVVSNSQSVMRAATSGGGAAATNGVISVQYLKDPSDAAMQNEPGVKLEHDILAKYAPGSDPSDSFYLYGMGAAFTMIDTLTKAGKNLTRENVMAAAFHLHETNNPFVLPGMVIETTPDDHFPIRQMQLSRYTDGKWVNFGALMSARK
jgi:branched-chain amino acid transport system substrate-binding protein